MLTKEIIKEIENHPENYAKSLSTQQLHDVIKELEYNYYEKESLVSDEIFDILTNELNNRSQINNNKIVKNEEIGFYITSMNKIKPNTDSLNKWLKNYKGPYTLSDKLDGVSGVLVKKNNILKLYKGRVSGTRNVAKNLSTLIDTMIKNKKEIPNNIAIRGEFIISKHNFEKIKNEFANERAAVTSVINSNTINFEIAKLIDFVTYTIVYPEEKHIDQLLKLRKLGFKVAEYVIYDELTNENLSNYMLSRRKNSEYVIDGIVVTDSSKSYQNSEENPEYAFAFKMLLTDQIAESTVLEVIWETTKDNYLIPKIRFEKVILNKTIIQYATANHAKFIYDNKIGVGSVVQIVKNNDIIPGILGVLKPTKPQMPNIPYIWSSSGVDIIATEITDRSKIQKMIYFFKTLGVKNISDGIITNLYDNGYTSITKILKANKTDIYKIDGLGKTVVNKIYDNIYKSLEKTELYTFMAASGCFDRHYGPKKMKLIVDHYPNILNMKKEEIHLIQIEGIGDILTKQFLTNFEKFIHFYEKINKIIDITHMKNPKKHICIGDIFKNKKVVFTGFRNKTFEKFIVDNCGTITNNISSNTNLVICDDDSTEKVKKAKKLNIQIMTKDEFYNKYIT